MSVFKAGDVVICILGGPIRCSDGHRHTGRCVPKKEAVLRVERLQEALLFNGRKCGCINLLFSDGSFGISHRFRKIQKADDAFTTQMRALKPIKQQA